MPKIVVVDCDFEDSQFEIDMVTKAGVEIACFNSRNPDEIIKNAVDADGIITSYGQFPARVFESLPNLQVVSRTGTGYDAIDIEAATKHGVAICNVPGYGTEVVSDHAIALALCSLRRINSTDADMRAGVWDYARHRPLGQVAGRTFGVIGMGDIGRAAARKAAGLGFRVVCWSRSLTPGQNLPEGYEVLELNEVLKQSDVVSLHVALSDDTYHLMNAERLALMKPGSILVNTSRGAVISTIALSQALEQGRLWGAGIDVFEEEPVDPGHPLLRAPRTVLTSHSAYWSEESSIELRTRCTQAALDVVLGRRPQDCVNPQVFKEA